MQPTAPLTESPAVKLPLIVPVRDPDHTAHAWCGRICVPKFLHKQFKSALGGPVTQRAQRMRVFYVKTIAAIPDEQPIGENPVKFWRRAFEAQCAHDVPQRVARASSSTEADTDTAERRRAAWAECDRREALLKEVSEEVWVASPEETRRRLRKAAREDLEGVCPGMTGDEREQAIDQKARLLLSAEFSPLEALVAERDRLLSPGRTSKAAENAFQRVVGGDRR